MEKKKVYITAAVLLLLGGVFLLFSQTALIELTGFVTIEVCDGAYETGSGDFVVTTTVTCEDEDFPVHVEESDSVVVNEDQLIPQEPAYSASDSEKDSLQSGEDEDVDIVGQTNDNIDPSLDPSIDPEESAGVTYDTKHDSPMDDFLPPTDVYELVLFCCLNLHFFYF